VHFRLLGSDKVGVVQLYGLFLEVAGPNGVSSGGCKTGKRGGRGGELSAGCQTLETLGTVR